jgi:hypothetical protein
MVLGVASAPASYLRPPVGDRGPPGYNAGMELFPRIGAHWFALVQTGAVTAALLFAGLAFVLDVRGRRASNLIRLSERHRDLWERLYTNPQLGRILDPDADVARTPVTPEEELFMIFVFLHLSDTWHVIKAGFFEKPDGLREDIRRFFSLPIPRTVWRKVRDLQDKPFARFVEDCWPKMTPVHGGEAA